MGQGRRHLPWRTCTVSGSQGYVYTMCFNSQLHRSYGTSSISTNVQILLKHSQTENYSIQQAAEPKSDIVICICKLTVSNPHCHKYGCTTSWYITIRRMVNTLWCYHDNCFCKVGAAACTVVFLKHNDNQLATLLPIPYGCKVNA